MEISCEALSKKATELNNNISYLQGEYNKLLQVVSSISKGWKGEEANGFINGIRSNYLAEMKNLISNMQKYQQFLSIVSPAYEALDDDYANKKIQV